MAIETKEIRKVKKTIVLGAYITKYCKASVWSERVGTSIPAVRVFFGSKYPDSQYCYAKDLRELADHFNELADILENKDV